MCSVTILHEPIWNLFTDLWNRSLFQLFMILITIELQFCSEKNYSNELKTELLLGGHIQSTHNRFHCLFCSTTKARGNLILPECGDQAIASGTPMVKGPKCSVCKPYMTLAKMSMITCLFSVDKRRKPVYITYVWYQLSLKFKTSRTFYND